jgi:hypothetical protein
VTVNNTLSAVIPTLYAKGLMALRHNAVMPRLVTNDFGNEVRQKGEIIQIPLPSAIATAAVVPAAYAPDPGNIAPTTAQIPLDSWYEAAFVLSEKEMAQIVDGIMPIQASAAVEALATQVNASILALYTTVGNSTGTAGTTPFASDVTAATNAGAILSQQLAPTTDRKMVLNPTAYGQALALPAFYGALYGGNTDMVKEGYIGRKFGFDWAEDQSIPVSAAGALTGTVTANGAQAAGLTSISIATAASSSFAPNAGNLIKFSGDNQTYSVQSGAALGASATGAFVIYPAKVVALAGGETVTITASATVNLAFHRQAFAFASRPLGRENLTMDTDMSMSVPDPQSGLSLRLTIREEFRRTRFAYDILWGVTSVRPQLACRVLG